MNNKSMLLACPNCGHHNVVTTYVQRVDANTLEHYCHSVKPFDDDSEARCIDCNWTGERQQLVRCVQGETP